MFSKESFMAGITIKKALLDAGLTQTELSKITGYSLGHLNSVICGRLSGNCERAKKHIALVLKLPYKTLWGNHQPNP
jgi:lambda repressor-like predicted transcriptional regulator